MIDKLREMISSNVREQVPMAPLTTIRIGGPAEYFLNAESAEEAVKAIKAAKELDLPLCVFGGGSNLLVNDQGVKGLVVRLANDDLAFADNAVSAGAGLASSRLAYEAGRAGWSGLEWMIALPGTVGGAIRGNAGMYGAETKDCLDSVLTVSPEGEPKVMGREECEMGYRDSAFKRLPGTIILSAKFVLEKSEPAACQKKMRETLAKKTAEQPVKGYSSGCMFKNWLPQSEEEIATVRQSLDLNREEVVPKTDTGAVPAGWIIDRAQLKGYKVGHCSVSRKHGNFVINDGQGTASEVLALTSAVKMKVRDMTHGIIMFEDEIEYAGY